MEIDLPQESVSNDPVSYLLKNVSSLKQQFVSIKSDVRRNLKKAEILAEREAILDAKRRELQEWAAATGTKVDEAVLGNFYSRIKNSTKFIFYV